MYHTRGFSALAFTGLALATVMALSKKGDQTKDLNVRCAATARGASAAVLVYRSVCDLERKR